MAGKIILFTNKRKGALQMMNYSTDATYDLISIPLDNSVVDESNTSRKYSQVNPYTKEDEKEMAKKLNALLESLEK